MTPDNQRAIEQKLATPFEASEVKWKAQTLTKDQKRALAVAYVDARVIQDRLDLVLGVMNWQDSYEALPDGNVICRLRIRLPGTVEWIEKTDVGGQSEQPDEGDRRKSAFSDALKRAAVKFGIGRYLYRLDAVWVNYDPHKKQLAEVPSLPVSAQPRPPIRQRTIEFEHKLVNKGLCKKGELLEHIEQLFSQAWEGREPGDWPEEAAARVEHECRVFADRHKQPANTPARKS